MRRIAMIVICFVGVAAWTGTAFAGDCKGCAKIKEKGEGFCSHCGSGKIFGVKLASKKLYDALAGDEAGIKKLKESSCTGCNTAAEKDGACKHCGLFVANGRVYRTATAQALARGKPVKEEHLKSCYNCAKAAKEDGHCTACDVHFVAHRSYKSKTFHEAALKAYETIKAAVKDAAHCETCAVARVGDGTCKACKVSFKYGKPVS